MLPDIDLKARLAPIMATSVSIAKTHIKKVPPTPKRTTEVKNTTRIVVVITVIHTNDRRLNFVAPNV